MNGIAFVGLDVHKATVSVALAEGGRGGEARLSGLLQTGPPDREAARAYR